MQQYAMIPPVALGTNGHLPAIVAQADGARPHPEPAGLLTEEQTTLTLDEGLGAHMTTPVETELRDIDSDAAWGDDSALPWLAARVVVHDDKPQAYGRTTKVWLDYGVHTGELAPAKAREALKAMREFADRYEALLDFADGVAAGDFEGDPEVARLDHEYEDRRIRAITEGRA